MNADINPYSSPKSDVEEAAYGYRKIPKTRWHFLVLTFSCAVVGIAWGGLSFLILGSVYLVLKNHVSIDWNHYGVHDGIIGEVIFLMGFLFVAWIMYRTEMKEDKA